MLSIIKTLFLLAILFCCSLTALPKSIEVSTQQTQAANGPCGDPSRESDLWTPVAGKVQEAIDGNTLIMSIKDKKRLLVHLVGIESSPLGQPFGIDAQRFLERLTKGKKIEVWVNPNHWIMKGPRPEEITGVVYLRNADRQDVNLSLVRAGMARHKPSKPYTMSRHTECQYTIAEEEARTAKRGLWQSAS
jgi:endonuclease YncB( thermonuclease family)